MYTWNVFLWSCRCCWFWYTFMVSLKSTLLDANILNSISQNCSICAAIRICRYGNTVNQLQIQTNQKKKLKKSTMWSVCILLTTCKYWLDVMLGAVKLNWYYTNIVFDTFNAKHTAP